METISLNSDVGQKLIDDIDLGMLYWAKLCQEHVRHRQSGLKVHAIRYEDIIGNRNFATRSILEYCGLSASLVDDDDVGYL